MLPREPISTSVWDKLEQFYLESASDQAKGTHAALSESDKRSALKAFAKSQAVKSKRWADIAQNLLSAVLNE
jgi:hypothetical protein